MVNNLVKKLSISLFKVAIESNKLDQVNKSIKDFAFEFFKIDSCLNGLHLDILNKSSKKEVLKVILDYVKSDKIFSNFIFILVDTNNLSCLKDFLKSWNELQKEFQGYEKVEVITAEKLTSEDEQKIENQLHKLLGKKFFLEKKVDQKIIAGLIVRSKNFEFNDSLLGRLNNISKSIKGALFNE